MFELKVITRFAAAHQLKMVAKQCENLHGHNWKIEVCVAGGSLNDAGVLIDFGKLKTYIATIIDSLDHKFLNELEYFKNGNPSSENIALYIAHKLQAMINEHGVKVSSVTAWESDDACATFKYQD
ncbi:MAG: 6-carboxytetrahydropterin synthase QueD [Deltaproteobacteria bacterium]|nr:6-carboxytetrahydropterin synthase QueD [Deltaproteobacteria bacterium]